MIRVLLLRRFLKNSKGISTVIGTVLLVLAMLTVASNILIFTISQNVQFSESVKESHQTDIDRFNEKIIASDGNYSVWGDNVKVEVTLTNIGAVATQIINLWVFDTTIQIYGFNNTLVSLDVNLNPGEILYLRGSDAIMISMPGASSTDNFNSWFVTGRGNTVAIEKTEQVIIAQVAQGIGLLGLDFNAFRYFFYDNDIPNKLQDYPAGVRGFSVPRRPEIAFGITLTNYDPLKRTIILNQYSQVWIYFPKAPNYPHVWHIMNVNSNGTITTPYSPIYLAYRQTKLLIFASKDPGSFNPVTISSAVKDKNPCALNLLLLGTVGSDDYGQNIPFVSLFVYEPS